MEGKIIAGFVMAVLTFILAVVAFCLPYWAKVTYRLTLPPVFANTLVDNVCADEASYFGLSFACFSGICASYTDSAGYFNTTQHLMGWAGALLLVRIVVGFVSGYIRPIASRPVLATSIIITLHAIIGILSFIAVLVFGLNFEVDKICSTLHVGFAIGVLFAFLNFLLAVLVFAKSDVKLREIFDQLKTEFSRTPNNEQVKPLTTKLDRLKVPLTAFDLLLYVTCEALPFWVYSTAPIGARSSRRVVYGGLWEVCYTNFTTGIPVCETEATPTMASVSGFFAALTLMFLMSSLILFTRSVVVFGRANDQSGGLAQISAGIVFIFAAILSMITFLCYLAAMNNLLPSIGVNETEYFQSAFETTVHAGVIIEILVSVFAFCTGIFIVATGKRNITEFPGMLRRSIRRSFSSMNRRASSLRRGSSRMASQPNIGDRSGDPPPGYDVTMGYKYTPNVEQHSASSVDNSLPPADRAQNSHAQPPEAGPTVNAGDKIQYGETRYTPAHGQPPKAGITVYAGDQMQYNETPNLHAYGKYTEARPTMNYDGV